MNTQEFNLPPPNAGCDRAPVGEPMKIFTGKRYVTVERIIGDRYRAIDPISDEDIALLGKLVSGQLRAHDTPAEEMEPNNKPDLAKVRSVPVGPMSEVLAPLEYVGTALSARDQLAAAALQGLIPSDRRVSPDEMRHTAKLAYQYADAMLEARR